MSEPYIGEIRMTGFAFAPQGWAFCDGSMLAISENTTLFSLIGTTYGGDGVNTFQLPNMIGRVPIHFDGNIFPHVGAAGGSEQSTLAIGQMPAHNHAFQAAATAATISSPGGAALAVAAADIYRAPSSLVPTSSVTSNGPGSGASHGNLMPFVCVNFIISLFGVYPSQN